MKEATGELNMTVITVVAVAAIAGIFYLFVWPSVQMAIATNTCKAYPANSTAYNMCIDNAKEVKIDSGGTVSAK